MKTISLAKNKDSFEVLKNWTRRFEGLLKFKHEKHRVDTDFGYTDVITTGPTDGEPVVLLHGAMSGAAFALSELSRLPERVRFIAVNIPGQSTEAAQVRLEFGKNEYATWISQIFDKMKLNQPCLVGVSLGGSVALDIVKDRPDLIGSLLLVVPGSIVSASPLEAFFKVGLPMLLYNLFPSERRRDAAFKHLITNKDTHWSPYLGEAYLNYRIDFSVPPIIKKDEMKGFTQPVFVIAAENDIQFPGPLLLERARKLFSNYKGDHLLKGSNHCPSFKNEDRELFVELVEKALASIKRH